MKRFIEPILLVALEIVVLLTLPFDLSMMFLLWTVSFAYFFVRRAVNQNEGVMKARGHKVLASNFITSPYDTHTLQKGIELESKVNNGNREPLQVKWIHLGLSLANAGALALLLLGVIPN